MNQEPKKSISLRLFGIFKYIAVILITAPLWTFLWWYFTPKTETNILIYDKTVLQGLGSEHRSFNWVLKHNRYVKLDFNDYGIKTDYMGFFPIERGKEYVTKDFEGYSGEQLDSFAEALEIAYYTDMYGIYSNEWYQAGDDKERSRKIYGGLTDKDVDLMKLLREKNKLLITEFNMIASPSAGQVRKRVEDEFGLVWSGWVGRYFQVLDTALNKELPKWITRLYSAQHHGKWPFKKSGIVMVNEDERIIILEEGTHLTFPVPMIETPLEIRKYFDLPKTQRYPFWFDITYPKDSGHIMANYVLKVNDEGAKELKEYNVPTTFPAVIGDYKKNRFYYFCGDYADNPIKNKTVYFKKVEYISSMFYEDTDLSQRNKFFWRYYRPLVTTIMDDYYKEIGK